MSRFGIGLERIPARDLGASWTDRVSLRLGMAITNTYFSPYNTGITEWDLTGGFSTPLSGDARLHVALVYGWRGTTNGNLSKDHIFRLNASISLSELWFIRSDEE